MLKSLIFILIIVERWRKTCDVPVGEVKKNGKFETVMVLSSQRTSEENNSKSKVTLSSSPKIQNVKRMAYKNEKRDWFTPSKHSPVCAEYFTEDSFEQNIAVRSSVGTLFQASILPF